MWSAKAGSPLVPKRVFGSTNKATPEGDVETRAHLLQHLDTVAVREGGFLYWSQTAAETSASLSVEISSYVLLAKLSASPTAEDLGYASGIIRWLTGQQNYYGGFSSTQVRHHPNSMQLIFEFIYSLGPNQKK
ncbi:alpha-1-inhibitor 3-like [Oreochromis aureus]|uniref:alpha-1-inhibitor 3-like n=1 Tax=Oreochromis aureus TaxID=47969 RepID=UPI0019549EC3|nr:alpha-1-inhibitor 3-like [Oreochromis aureus]